MATTNASLIAKASEKASELFPQIFPGVVEATASLDGTFSVMGTEELAAAARMVGLTVVDWSGDEDFVLCGTPFEVYVSMSDLERLLGRGEGR